MTGRIKVGVVGVGDFGRNHVRLYRDLDSASLVGVYDTDAARAHSVAQEFGTRVFDSLDALAAAVQAVSPAGGGASVAVPTRDHARVASELLRRGVDVLVEKPIAASLAEADDLIRISEAEGRILQVG
ncbi:MAG: Gfo/Idh/MocA family protein, partial [Candidatus Acidiferrales bacterium]